MNLSAGNSKDTKASRRWLINLSPLIVVVALIAWTAVVSPHSKYGDDWAIVPAVISFPLFVLWNIVLVFFWKGKMPAVLRAALGGCYVLVSGAIFFWIWILCLMAISKDSL